MVFITTEILENIYSLEPIIYSLEPIIYSLEPIAELFPVFNFNFFPFNFSIFNLFTFTQKKREIETQTEQFSIKNKIKLIKCSDGILLLINKDTVILDYDFNILHTTVEIKNF
jgi:hypothetical protein